MSVEVARQEIGCHELPAPEEEIQALGSSLGELLDNFYSIFAEVVYQLKKEETQENVKAK